MSEPFGTKTSNTGRDDFWTCPACYADLPNKRPGVVDCPKCNAKVRCTIEGVPDAVSVIVGSVDDYKHDEDEDDDDDRVRRDPDFEREPDGRD